MKIRIALLAVVAAIGFAWAQTGGRTETSGQVGGSVRGGGSASARASAGGSGSGSADGFGTGTAIGGTVYAVRYTFDRGFEPERMPDARVRNAMFGRLESSGMLVLGGALPTVPGELYLIRGRSEEHVRQLIANDPFANDPLVTVEVREYRIERPSARVPQPDRE